MAEKKEIVSKGIVRPGGAPTEANAQVSENNAVSPKIRLSLPKMPFDTSEVFQQIKDPLNVSLVALWAIGLTTSASLETITNFLTKSKSQTPTLPEATSLVYQRSGSVRPGEIVEVGRNGVVSGDIIIYGKGQPLITFDKDPKTGSLTIVKQPVVVEFPYGGHIKYVEKDDDKTINDNVNEMKKNGCIQGCAIVHVHQIY